VENIGIMPGADSKFFSVHQPTGTESAVVVEIPHAGLLIDPLALATLSAPARAVGTDADLYVDELYNSAAEHGATVLVAHTSRYVCDLNRSETDIDSRAVVGAKGPQAPHGLIWRRTTEEQPALLAPLSRFEFERRLKAIYRPYHQTLTALLEDKRRRFGYVILLCAHSMPSRGRSGHTDPGTHRADVVPGSRGYTTAARPLIDLPEDLARKRGWSVAHDDPYRGGFSTGFYGRPEQGMHAVQVELARRLYMDEDTLQKKDAPFVKTAEYCSELVAELGKITLG
jgi:N-formylglutamate amidohydrolase